MDKALVIGRQAVDNVELTSQLERHDYQVLTAMGRAEALEQLDEEQPDLVVVDHEVDGQDGVAVLNAVRAARPTADVIFITAAGEMDTAIEVLRAGGLDYLHHPLDTMQLRVALGRARERRPLCAVNAPAVILVLEDHEPTRRRLATVLSKEGYEVATAADGEEGMRLFGSQRFDLLLADVRMPKKDGLTVLHQTKGAGADIEVIVMSGYGDEEMVVRALRDGAINFLRKPIDLDQMLLAIEKALEFQVMRRSLAHRNRDLELMQELVLRLTREQEVVVETPSQLSQATTEFLQRLVDALPFGLVVVGADRSILFANRHVLEKVGKQPEQLSPDWLEHLGVSNLSDGDLLDSLERNLAAKPGTVETLAMSNWSFLVMTPIRLVRPDGTRRFVAIAIRGERGKASDSGRRERA